jgi:hypothetical protein
MRAKCVMVVLMAGSICASAQSMLETAAAAAGGTAGGVAGKKVSDGLTKIFGKVDKQTQKAAKAGEPKHTAITPDTSTPLLEVGPGVPKAGADPSNVPPPPPIKRASVRKPAPAPVAMVVEPPPPAPAPPPPAPEVTAADLKVVANGMQRADVLKIGEPSARVTMTEDGHLLEIYRYQAKDTTFGVVRLTDGAVSNVFIR